MSQDDDDGCGCVLFCVALVICVFLIGLAFRAFKLGAGLP